MGSCWKMATAGQRISIYGFGGEEGSLSGEELKCTVSVGWPAYVVVQEPTLRAGEVVFAVFASLLGTDDDRRMDRGVMVNDPEGFGKKR